MSPAFYCDWAELDARNRGACSPTGDTEWGTEMAEEHNLSGMGRRAEWEVGAGQACGLRARVLQAGGDCAVSSGGHPVLL